MNARMLVLTAVVGILLLGGAFFGWQKYSENQPAFRGRAIPVAGLKEELVNKWTEAFETALKDEEVLKSIVEESDYAASLDVPAGEAVGHLKEAVKVRFRNRNDAIEVGLVGKRKNDEALIKISKVLFEEAQVKVIEEISPDFQMYLDMVEEQRAKQAAGQESE